MSAGQPQRFDGAAAWRRLTAEEQAEIGRLAIESTVCVHAEGLHAIEGLPTTGWIVEPDDAELEITGLMDEAVARALERLGLLGDDVMSDPPSALDGLSP
jgi:hypothetical protein